MLEELQLDRRLQLALDALSFDSTTEVQSQVIPAALAGGDLVVSAETGSGKTLAYLVPTVQRLLASDAPREYGPAALVLVPTRELARQVLKHCRALLAKTPLQVYGITGGADFRYQESLFRKNPEIIVATPGRLLEHCERKSTSLAELQVLVLDEADRMLDMGFRDDVLKIIGYSPDSRQVIMVSATLNHRELGAISRSLLKTPQTIAVGTAREPHSTIDHQVMLADGQEHKDKLLFALLEQGGYGRVLVFGNKRSTAIRLAGLLKYHKLRCACLHGEMSTEDRRQVITRFNDGKLSILCASDVAARGIDIKDIDLVINYDLPHSGDDYLHRTGRTGRAGASGLALSLVTATDWNLMISIERYLKLDFQRRSLPGLKARFNGPKKQKASGKAAGSKKKVPKPAAAKSKSRKRNQKNVGKPSARVKRDPAEKNDGFAPLMKKKPRP
ncbi:MAG: DEAD/DEAH box helicase [Pseudomonadales bacterium]|nr:DEAD/DEAH box helicase [Pseudomonadales bacterium]